MDRGPKKPFRFKQFQVHHDRCAMKVNTDGVLLGAWANVDGVQHALDVGTGSGVIALMLAQRGVAHTIALEIDTEAATQATENFKASPWADKLWAYPLALQHFMHDTPYDLIISNPPYFDNAYKTPIASRNLARHNDSLPLADLMDYAQEWLAYNGRLCLILPFDMEMAANQAAEKASLYPTRCCYVKGTIDGETKRVLMEFGRQRAQPQISHLAIETAPLQYTEEYKALTKDFYLAF